MPSRPRSTAASLRQKRSVSGSPAPSLRRAPVPAEVRASAPPASRSGLSALERRVLTLIIYAEIAINVANGAVSLASPLAALGPLSLVPFPPLAGEVARWFGAVTLAFGGVLLARSLSSPPALRRAFEALCIGDVLYLAALAPFAAAHGSFPAIAAPFLLTFIMFAARLRWLLGEDWAAEEAAAARATLAAATSAHFNQ